MPHNRYLGTQAGRTKLGHSLKHPLALRLQYLEQHPTEGLAWIRLARTVTQVDQLLSRSRARATSRAEDQLFSELDELRESAILRLKTLEQPGRGDQARAAGCATCLGSSNCGHCFQGYLIDEARCRVCGGTGACQHCSAPEIRTLWQHLLEPDSV